MLGRDARAGVGRAFAPIARTLVRLHITPDALTWGGTIATCALALALLIPGHFVVGSLLLTLMVLMDSLDGLVARMTGTSSRWGAFLDSTLDRIADGVVLGALCLHFLAVAERTPLSIACGALALAALILGAVISYAKARAESLGMSADVGLMERADRFVVLLVGIMLAGLIGPWAMLAALSILVVLSAWTVGQRMAAVHRQGARTAA